MKSLTFFILLVLGLWFLASVSCVPHIQNHLAENTAKTLNAAIPQKVAVEPGVGEKVQGVALHVRVKGRKPYLIGELNPPAGTIDKEAWFETRKEELRALLDEKEDKLGWNARELGFDELKLGAVQAAVPAITPDPGGNPALVTGENPDTGTAAVDPAVTPAVDPAVIPAVDPAVTPAVDPAVTPAVDPAPGVATMPRSAFRMQAADDALTLRGNLPTQTDIDATLAAAKTAFPSRADKIDNQLTAGSRGEAWVPKLPDLIRAAGGSDGSNTGNLAITPAGELRLSGPLSAPDGSLQQAVAGLGGAFTLPASAVPTVDPTTPDTAAKALVPAPAPTTPDTTAKAPVPPPGPTTPDTAAKALVPAPAPTTPDTAAKALVPPPGPTTPDTTAKAPAPIPAPPPEPVPVPAATLPSSFNLNVDPDSLVLSGTLPGEAERAAVVGAAKAAFPDQAEGLVDETKLGGIMAPWIDSLVPAIKSFGSLKGPQGSLRFNDDGQLSVDGELDEAGLASFNALGEQAGLKILTGSDAEPVNLEGPPLSFRLIFTNKTITLEGELPRRSDVRSTIEATKGAFPDYADAVTSKLTATSAPVAWMPRLQDLIATFSRMLDGKHGSLTIENGGDLDIHGEVKDNARGAFRALAKGIDGIQLPADAIKTP